MTPSEFRRRLLSDTDTRLASVIAEIFFKILERVLMLAAVGVAASAAQGRGHSVLLGLYILGFAVLTPWIANYIVGAAALLLEERAKRRFDVWNIVALLAGMSAAIVSSLLVLLFVNQLSQWLLGPAAARLR